MSESDRTPTKRQKQVKKAVPLGPPLGRFADPPPEGYSSEAVQCFLTQIETQLKLAKTLVDDITSFEDAVDLLKLVQESIKELKVHADTCIADWSVSVNDAENKKAWLQATYLDETVETEEPKPRIVNNLTSRWTPDEVACFDEALKEIDYTKRGATKLIQARIPTRTLIQVRDRLRRVKEKEGKLPRKEEASSQ